MTIEEVKARVAEIEALKDDDAHAHVLQDQLFVDVLRFIGKSAELEECPKLAGAALAVLDIEFCRWFS